MTPICYEVFGPRRTMLPAAASEDCLLFSDGGRCYRLSASLELQAIPGTDSPVKRLVPLPGGGVRWLSAESWGSDSETHFSAEVYTLSPENDLTITPLPQLPPVPQGDEIRFAVDERYLYLLIQGMNAWPLYRVELETGDSRVLEDVGECFYAEAPGDVWQTLDGRLYLPSVLLSRDDDTVRASVAVDFERKAIDVLHETPQEYAPAPWFDLQRGVLYTTPRPGEDVPGGLSGEETLVVGDVPLPPPPRDPALDALLQELGLEPDEPSAARRREGGPWVMVPRDIRPDAPIRRDLPVWRFPESCLPSFVCGGAALWERYPFSFGRVLPDGTPVAYYEREETGLRCLFPWPQRGLVAVWDTAFRELRLFPMGADPWTGAPLATLPLIAEASPDDAEE